MGVRPGPFRSRGESHVGATGEQLLDQVRGEVDFALEPDVRHIGLQSRDEGGKATRRRDLASADPNPPARLALAAAGKKHNLHVSTQGLGVAYTLATRRGERQLVASEAQARGTPHM